jgi:hypothetical protein
MEGCSGEEDKGEVNCEGVRLEAGQRERTGQGQGREREKKGG